MIKRLFSSLLTVGLAAAFMVTADPIIGQSGYFGVSSAEAQRVRKTKRKRRNLFEILFGGSRRRNVKKVSKQNMSRKRRGAHRKYLSAPILAPVEKLDDAKVVLVVSPSSSNAV